MKDKASTVTAVRRRQQVYHQLEVSSVVHTAVASISYQPYDMTLHENPECRTHFGEGAFRVHFGSPFPHMSCWHRCAFEREKWPHFVRVLLQTPIGIVDIFG